MLMKVCAHTMEWGEEQFSGIAFGDRRLSKEF